MKTFRTLITVVSLGILLTYAGCGGGGSTPESVQAKNLKLFIKSTWKIADPTGNSVFLGNPGVDSTEHWKNFTITLSNPSTSGTTYNYVCTGRPKLSAWQAAGTWKFSDTTPESSIVRVEDGLVIGYTFNAAGTTLQLTYDFEGAGYTRVDNVSGHWTIKLIPSN